MNILTDKNGNPITMGRVCEVFKKTEHDMYHDYRDAADSYFSNIELFSRELDMGEDKIVPNLMDIAAVCAVQKSTLRTVRKILCELLGVEKVPAGEGDVQT